MYNEVNFAGFFLDEKKEKKINFKLFWKYVRLCSFSPKICFGKLDFLSNYFD